MLDLEQLHLSNWGLFRCIVSSKNKFTFFIVMEVLFFSSNVLLLCYCQMVIPCSHSSLCCLSFDFSLILLKIKFDHLSLAFIMLTAIQHDCKVNVKGITWELIKSIINKLEDQHVSYVKIVFLECFNVPFELFHCQFETAKSACRTAHLENRIFHIFYIILFLVSPE